MKRLGFLSASVSTVGKVGLKNKRPQTSEPQLFYIVCYGAFFLNLSGFICICPPIALSTFIIVSN